MKTVFKTIAAEYAVGSVVMGVIAYREFRGLSKATKQDYRDKPLALVADFAFAIGLWPVIIYKSVKDAL